MSLKRQLARLSLLLGLVGCGDTITATIPSSPRSNTDYGTPEGGWPELSETEASTAAAGFSISGSAAVTSATTQADFWSVGTLNYSWATAYSLTVGGAIYQGSTIVGTPPTPKVRTRAGVSMGFSGSVKDSVKILNQNTCGVTAKSAVTVSGSLIFKPTSKIGLDTLGASTLSYEEFFNMSACNEPVVASDEGFEEPNRSLSCVTDERRGARTNLDKSRSTSSGYLPSAYDESWLCGDWYCAILYYGERVISTGQILWYEQAEFCWDEYGAKVSGPPGFGEDGPVYRAGRSLLRATPSLGSPSARRVRGPKNNAPTDYRAHLFATGPLARGQKTQIHKTEGPGSALVVIAVDTTSASEKDVAAAVRVASLMLALPEANEVFTRSSSVRSPKQVDAQAMSTARVAYRMAKKSSVIQMKNVGEGRRLEFRLPAPSVKR